MFEVDSAYLSISSGPGGGSRYWTVCSGLSLWPQACSQTDRPEAFSDAGPGVTMWTVLVCSEVSHSLPYWLWRWRLFLLGPRREPNGGVG